MQRELRAILGTAFACEDDPAALAGELYGRCYMRSILDPAPPTGDTPAEDLNGILAAANGSRGEWVHGWTIEQVLDDGRILARRNGAVRAFLPGEYITQRGIGMGVKEGIEIAVYPAPGSAAIQESFYFAFGEAVAEYETGSTVRIYWNVRSEGVARLMEAVTGEFNRFQVPFRFKCLNRTSLFPRRDAAVLYIDRRFYPIAALLVESIRCQVVSHLNAGTPLFTKRLAHGLALAEDPGDSFGKHRCTILAQAMAASRGRAVQDRLVEVARQFAQRGLSLDAPWLNAGSPGGYEYPFPTA